ncbi:MAG: DUF928 domain-containing protein [Cyanobacteria bacterium J06592_8]
MHSQLFSRRSLSILITLSLGLAIGSSLPVEAGPSSTRRIPVRVAFQPPKGQGMPTRTAGGASRTGTTCPTMAIDQTELTALVPAFLAENSISSNSTGLTTQATPTFYFFVPAIAGQQAVFSLKDENHQDIYQTRIPLSGKVGIVSVKLPADVPPLEISKSYRWSFGIVCQAQSPQQQSGVVFVTGEIRRVEVDTTLTHQLQQITPLEQAALYAENGIWFDSMEIIANLRKTQPNDITLDQKWEELLNSVNLGDIAQQPFINP